MPSPTDIRLRVVETSSTNVRLQETPVVERQLVYTHLHEVGDGGNVSLRSPLALEPDPIPTSQPIDHVLATATGPINASGASADTTPTNTGCTATLTAGRWLIVAMMSHSNLEGTGGLTESSELELRQNSTRIGVSRWDSAFSFYGYLGTTPNNVGTSLKVMAVVDAAGGDTISLWLRRENNGNGDTSAIVAIDGVIKAINLDLFTEGVDYWYAAGPNSDAAEATASGTSWATGATSGRIGQGVGEVPMTAPAGDCWVLASGEGFLTATVGSTEISRARLRRADTGTTIGTGVEHQVHHEGGQPTTFVVNFFEEDVLTFSGGETPELQWEISNGSGGTSVQWRRSRIFVLRAGALADFQYIANAGDIVEPGGTTVEATNGLTFDFGTSIPTVISSTATWQSGGANWGRAWLHQDAGDVHWPPSGRIEAFIPAYEVVGTSGDEAPIHFGTIISQTGSVTWRLADQSDSGANQHTLGRNLANNAAARTVLVAFPLLTSGGSGTPDVDGTFSATLPIPGMVASGYRAHHGQLAASLPIATSTMAGDVEATQQVAEGDLVANTTVPTMSASGQRVEAGTLAGTIPILTGALAGTRARAAVIAASLLVPTMAAAATNVDAFGPFAATTPMPTATIAGYAARSSAFAGSLPVLAMSAAGLTVDAFGPLAVTLPMPTSAMSASSRHVGTLTTSLPIPATAMTGQRIELGTCAASLPVPTTTIAGQRVETGTFSGTLPLAIAELEGTAIGEGSFVGELPMPTMSSAGAAAHHGAIAATLPIATCSAAGIVRDVWGGLVASLPVPATTQGGTVARAGALAGQLPTPTMVAAGVVRDVFGDLATSLPVPTTTMAAQRVELGAIACALPIPVGELAGDVAHVGTLATSLPLPVLAASGSGPIDVAGALAGVLPIPVAAMAGTDARAGALAANLPMPVAALVAQRVELGALNAALPIATMLAAGQATQPGQLVASLPMPAMTAAGVSLLEAAFAASLPVPTLAAAGLSVDVYGALTGTLPRPVLAGAGGRLVVGGLTSALLVPTMSAAGNARHAGVLGLSLPVPNGALAGVVVHQIAGSLLGQLPLATMAAAARMVETGTFAASLPLPLAAIDARARHEGALVGTLPVVGLSAAGTVVDVHGQLALALPRLTLAAAGLVVDAYGALISDLPRLAMSAAGRRNEIGALAGTIPLVVAAAQAVALHEGGFASQLPIPAAAMQAIRRLGADIIGRLPLPVAAAAGEAVRQSLLAGVLPMPLASMLAELGHAGTIAGALPLPVLVASATLYHGALDVRLPLPGMAGAGWILAHRVPARTGVTAPVGPVRLIVPLERAQLPATPSPLRDGDAVSIAIGNRAIVVTTVMPNTRDIVIQQGASFDLDVRVVNQDRSDFAALASYDASADVRVAQSTESELIAEFEITYDLPNSTVRLHLDADVTAGMTAGYYDLLLVRTDDPTDVLRVIQGRVRLDPGVTIPGPG